MKFNILYDVMMNLGTRKALGSFLWVIGNGLYSKHNLGIMSKLYFGLYLMLFSFIFLFLGEDAEGTKDDDMWIRVLIIPHFFYPYQCGYLLDYYVIIWLLWSRIVVIFIFVSMFYNAIFITMFWLGLENTKKCIIIKSGTGCVVGFSMMKVCFRNSTGFDICKINTIFNVFKPIY